MWKGRAMTATIATFLQSHPAEAKAIGAPGRPWLTFGGLRALSKTVGSRLNGFGIGPGDRVAIVLPNGPEMAAAFITTAQAAVTAPLNPAYREEDFAFYLEDLRARAIVVGADENGPAVAAASRLELKVLRLVSDLTGPAGEFDLVGEASDVATGAPGAEDVALILHTSGTTSRPKIVPLLHRNVAASASNVGAALALGSEDRCMNVMPLFHIHGLIAAVSASLAAGGSVWCAPGFDALKFFGWMSEACPSWYTAVPTMHQAILARAARNSEVISATPLRLIRSSSASLPPQVFAALTETFKAPVIESYGMTEAAHQMASNPLAAGAQKPGSVGVAAGPALRTAHETEDRLVEGTGEVVISGPNVTPGYESNAEANAKSFFDAEGARWFRTGDQGELDAEGYLRLTGRLKEIINRGGEKISPLEVDDVLMDHPAIQQCVAFAIPHDRLGEEVGVAVVLREGAQATEREIRAYAASRMTGFKVPRRVVILAEIPKGATGKMQRIGMAAKLGLA